MGDRPFDDYPKIMDTAQVAEMLMIGRAEIVRKMARQGRLPAHREAGARDWWFDRDELIEWMRSETKVTPAAE